MSVTVRPASIGDVDAMYRLTCEVHLGGLYKNLIPAKEYPRFATRFTQDAGGLARYRRRMLPRLSDRTWQLWVAELDEVICGFTLAHRTEGYVELRGLFVADAYQGRGIGQQLFQVSCGAAQPGQAIELEVIETNERAIRLYTKNGFVSLGRTGTSFYGAAKIRMRKH